MFSDVGDMRYMAGVSGIGCRLALMLKWTVTCMKSQYCGAELQRVSPYAGGPQVVDAQYGADDIARLRVDHEHLPLDFGRVCDIDGFVLGVGVCNWRIQVQDALDGSCRRVSGGVVVCGIGQQEAKQSKAKQYLSGGPSES